MKKLLCLILALVMMFVLFGCTFDADPSESGENDNDEPTSQTKENDEPVINFEEMTVVDNDECTVKITGIDPDNMWGYTLEVYLENKSAEKTYMYSVTASSVNGVQNDPLFAAEVAPGKKSNEEINYVDSELAEIIGTFTDIALSFRVYDSEDWTAEPVAETTVHVYPLGEENATAYVRTAEDTDTVLVDNDYVTVIAIGYESDEIWGYCANLYLVNKTDTEVMFSAEEVSVNGYMCDPFYACAVGAGTCAFSTMSWMDSTFEDNGIKEVEEIEMRLRVYDYDDWTADDFVNETVTLNP